MKSSSIITAVVLLCSHKVFGQDLFSILGACHTNSTNFDKCMKRAFNDLRTYFKPGLPEYNINPFDPHKAPYIETRRGNTNALGGFKLILRNVSEYGWTNSEVTKYKTDFQGNRIVYSQYFPEKSLDGQYDFTAKIIGSPIRNRGVWNLTLYDYSQTTSVKRLGGPGSLLKVHVEVDKIGGMSLHISDFFGNRQVLNNIADTVINTMWKPGLPFVIPLINELVSTAFTDIFNESFRYFPIENFIKG